MNIDVSPVSNTRKAIQVSFEASEVDAEHKKLVAEFARQARIPGFRPGKAPASVVAKRFEKDLVGELATALARTAFKEATEKHGLKVLGVVKTDAGTPAPGKPAEIRIEVDLQPEFELPEYKALPVTVEEVSVTEAEVEEMIERLRRERSDFQEVERESAAGDYVKIKYTGTIDGSPVADLAADRQVFSHMDQTWEEAGSADSLIPGMGAGLVGMKKGDTREVSCTFPETFVVEPLRGKTAVYTVESLEVRERKLPELNEEFLKSFNVESVDALKEDVASRLKTGKAQRQESAKREQVTQRLAAQIQTDFPEDMIEAETQQMLRRFITENMRRGVPQDEFEKRKEELHASARVAAVDRLKVEFALGRIAEKEGIKVTENDLMRVISAEAQRTNSTVEKLAKELGKNRDRLRTLQNRVLLDKTLEFVVSQATLTEAAPAAAS